MPAARRPRIGLALGSGAARGWSHIGVLQELQARKVPIDVIAGASIGAVVGGCFAGGRLDALEAFALSLTKRRVFSLMDVAFSGAGVLSGGKLRDELARELSGKVIDGLPIKFGAVATEIGSGHEVWLRHGDLVQAIRASYAMPGIFEPVRIDNRWLFDGALVNPVPVTLCRAMGAELVIAVNLVGDTSYRGALITDATRPEPDVTRGKRRKQRLQRSAAIATSIRARRQRRAGYRRRDAGRLQHHPGPHRALASCRRSAGRAYQRPLVENRPVRISSRRRIDRHRPRGGAAGAERDRRGRRD